MHFVLFYLLVSSPLAGTYPQDAPPELGGWLADRAVSEPGGVAFLPGGGLAVTSRTDRHVALFDGAGQRVGTLAKGELRRPGAIEADAEGRLFLSDAGRREVLVLEEAGVRVFAGSEHLVRPAGLDVDGEHVAVADPAADRVQLFRRDGSLAATLTEGLLAPTAVSLGDGEAFVADSGHQQVAVFDLEGQPLRRFGDWGFFPGLFASISDLEFEAGRLYVCDAENHRVQSFTAKGDLVARFGLHAIRPGEGQGKLHYPSALAIAPGGLMAALAEPLDDRVQLFGEQGEVDPVDAMRMANTQPSAHFGEQLCVDEAHMVIVEPETHELKIFDLNWEEEPRLIGRLGGYGASLGLFNRPLDAAIDGETFDLFVVDGIGRALHHARLAIDPEEDARFDLEMATWGKRLDFTRLGHQLGETQLDAPIQPVAIELSEEELFLLDARNGQVHVFGRDLSYRRSFGEIEDGTDLCLDLDRKLIWVADRQLQCLHSYTLEGVLGPTVEALDDVFGVCVDDEGQLWVSVSGERPGAVRIRLSSAGEEREHFGERGLGRVQFHQPRSLEYDRRGRIVVLDHGNHRVQWITKEGEYVDVFGSRLYTKPARLPHTAEGATEQGEEEGR